MSEVTDVRLPSGELVKNVPVGMSQTELQDLLIKNEKVSPDVFAQPKPEPTPEPEVDFPWYQDIYQYVKGNVDLPAGIAGGVYGARKGAPLGPKASFLGGMAGGAIGTFGGKLASDVFTGEELNYEEAFDDAMLSAGIDVATLGAFKVANPLYTMVRNRLKLTPKQAADDALEIINKGLEAGTPESLQATQKILEEKGATLTRFQTGMASAWEVFAEKLGQAGLFSGRESAKNIAKVNQAVQESLNDITSSVRIRTGDSPTEVGESILDVITAGRMALSDAYGEGLDALSTGLSKNAVDVSPLKNQILAFQKQNTVLTRGRDAQGKIVTERKSLLSDETTNFINKHLEDILQYPNMTGDSLLKIDKMLTQEMKQFGDISSKNYNDTVAKQLGDLQNQIKTGVLDVLKKTDPKAAKQYEQLKNDYSAGMKGLLPEINARVVKNAEKGSYDALGKLLTTNSDVSKINNMLNSIDNAYKQLAKTEGLPTEIAYGTAKEAKAAIRRSFLKNLMPKIDSPDFDISEYASLAARFSKPSEKARLKAIMGEDYGQVNQLFNAMSEASKTPDGNLGVLFLRGKEFQTGGELVKLGQGAALGASALAGSPLATVGSAALILGSPIFLSKMAYNKKAVNRLLAFNKANFADDIAREKAALFIVSDVIDALTPEEQQEIVDAIKLRPFANEEM
jgi:hypothetical protein